MNEKAKKIVKWIAVIAAAIGAAAAVIMEQGCTHKHHLKASGIKIFLTAYFFATLLFVELV